MFKKSAQKMSFSYHFQSIYESLINEKNLQCFKMFLNIISSLNSFQIILHVFIIY